MPLKALPRDFPIHTFSSAKEFEAYLDKEHETTGGCYIKLAKKASGIPSITAPEAVVVCLQFGWIDGGGGGTIDENFWLTRYTPRRPRSLWSKKNTETVVQLLQENKMRPAGIAQVEAAKADGRWARAYDGKTIPDDLSIALAAKPAALTMFQSLNGTDRYSVLHRVQTSSVKTRDARVAAIVQTLASRAVPGKATPRISKVKQIKQTDRRPAKSRASSPSKPIAKATTPLLSRSRRPGLRSGG
jgi:uncharacterized protein YdeI (YjbR/CyaY-like superfamily)